MTIELVHWLTKEVPSELIMLESVIMRSRLSSPTSEQTVSLGNIARIRDRVSSTNPTDLYQFHLSDSSRFSFRFKSSSRGATAQIIQDRNQNGLAEAGEVLRTLPSQVQRSSSQESDSFTAPDLPAGNYWVRISANGSQKSNYEFRLVAQPSSNSTLNSTLQPQATTAKQLKRFVNQVFTLTNKFRREHGLAALKLNSKLSTAAQTHSQNMALQDFFSHTGADGSTISNRIAAAGYRWSAVAENIAAGYTTPTAVVQGWINSPGHRANLLNGNLKEIGVGYYFLANDTGTQNWNHYWTQNFGAPR